jgi:molybdopterin synthase catalytic subunit
MIMATLLVPSALACPFVLTSEPVPQAPPFSLTSSMGAIVSFQGIVRDNNDGKAVVEIEYSAYPELAEREGNRIVRESIERFGLLAGGSVHRLGLLRPGDVAVRVWAAAAHRREAFLACEFVIDAIKATVPIWKRETYASGDKAWVTCQAHAGEEMRAADSGGVEGNQLAAAVAVGPAEIVR